METMETNSVSGVSTDQRAEAILDAAARLFFAPGPGRVSMDDLARDLGMSKKTIYRWFPDKQSLMMAVLDRQFEIIEHTLSTAVTAADLPFDVRVQRFLAAASTELQRIGAAQLATGRGDAGLRRHVERRIDEVIYRRLAALFRDGHRRGLLAAPPQLLAEITRGAVERLLNSDLPSELDCTAGDLIRTTVDTLLYGALRPADEEVAS
ncbi:TetR/AcrR family transcriptional regulator [Nocardia sp. BMG111209]|uniref:TetR/AcrR family transcriptional regulator n=1 Tax=Nocardia sp. BMG111209 TaxID=1160137 RepID=UPI0003998714|nr:TetR/AcrR family transcriptional regulator [Nocardia sp. BMG111209]